MKKSFRAIDPSRARTLFVIVLLSTIPLAFLVQIERWALLASYLVAPSGWIVWSWIAAMTVGAVQAVRMACRDIRIAKHLRDSAAPPRPYTGLVILASLFFFNGLLSGGIAVATRAAAPPMSRTQWAKAVNNVKDEIVPYMPDIR